MSEPILIDESFFDDSYVPERILCQRPQVREMARCLGRLKSGKSTKNLHVYGPPGAGKTSSVKWMLKKEFGKSHAYVNCWSKRTQHKILESVLGQMGCFVHGAEPTSKLAERFMGKARKGFVICLDECDQIEDPEILYNIGRSPCTLILISNENDFFANADARIESSLALERCEFKPYSRKEAISILRDRVSCGFRQDSLSSGLLSKIAAMCGGDARIALQTLRIAAINAELKSLDKVTITEIKEAAKCTRKRRLSYLLGKLNIFQKTIFEVLSENRKMRSRELYERCRWTGGQCLPKRTYRHYMRGMAELSLVRTSGTKRWRTYEIT